MHMSDKTSSAAVRSIQALTLSVRVSFSQSYGPVRDPGNTKLDHKGFLGKDAL